MCPQTKVKFTESPQKQILSRGTFVKSYIIPCTSLPRKTAVKIRYSYESVGRYHATVFRLESAQCYRHFLWTFFVSLDSPRRTMPIKPPTRNTPDETPSFRKLSPSVARHLSVIFIPESPQCLCHFFLGFFASLEYLQ